MEAASPMQNQSLDNQVGIALPWLVGLRWGAMGCQALLILILVRFFEIPVPFLLTAMIFTFGILSNLFLHFLKRKQVRVSDEIVTSILLLDTGLLTMLLFLTGGAMNPFTFLYLVHLVLGAVLLPVRWSWTIMVTTIICYGTLFFPGVETIGALGGHPPACHVMAEVSGPMLLHLKGMWVAYTITAVCVVFFVGKIQKSLTLQRQTRISLEKERVRSEMLASLATLAAGATHELSTPLSTIAVASAEMIDTLQGRQEDDELLDDAILIRNQIDGCKEILFQMTADAGEHLGEEDRNFSTAEAITWIVNGLKPNQQDSVRVENSATDLVLKMPFRTLCNSISCLVKNGLEASESGDPVLMKWLQRENKLLVIIQDQGHGMNQDTMEKSVDPFFTTKDEGQGLGLFLAHTMADRFGGTLEVDSTFGEGTTITLSLDLARI